MMSTILKHIGFQRKIRNQTVNCVDFSYFIFGFEGDRKGFEGLVDHTLESEEVDNAKTKDVDTDGDEDVHTVGTPPWLRFNIKLEKPINVLEKNVEIRLEEPIDVVDDEVEIEDSGKKFRTHFDSDVTEMEPFSTQRRPVRRKHASVYLSTPFTTLPKRFTISITTTF
ncbi:uncharacterized protein E5676_scaffold209G00880 [Cucumis melo var. makuwa]|uniref:Ulp1-like peptidase n=1 Tax=Cucumis melo var. makuwa TaxID=1194695 RepID=A0A5A7U2C8_CUCMM|nr:uncharacterized protein E6C27_scaffold171G007340 [Cucumis melo var. makuwa]TYK16160.1 uncharacterized protein E5676_scaffold209G00880 [Cucumis melo var. makuwa]